jgi:hypothetical protein
VEELAFWLIDTLVSVSTEEITLRLEEIRRESLRTVSIVVTE